MRRVVRFECFAFVIALLVATSRPADGQTDSSALRVAWTAQNATAEQQHRVLATAARSAWSYVRRNSFARSGLVKALDSWEYVTIWDIASAVAALYSAHGLGLLDSADYHARMNRVLATLENVSLYQNAAFNKQYASSTAAMVDRDQHTSTRGIGWSAVDIGRFLVWMKIIAASDSSFAPAANRIVKRLDMSRLVKDGYLTGANVDVGDNNHYEYQEGRLGYEQYAAQGFALWGARADKALDFSANGTPISIYGVQLLADRRGDDLLTSEPFIMMGLELGWPDSVWSTQARNVLEAQRLRYERTGRMTMLSEDAVPVKPAYFYYYVLHDGHDNFVVRSPTGQTSASYPRWISAKAAFGWHALFPGAYTWRAVKAVLPAGSSGAGWRAGVYERSRRPTPGYNLNTAALVLEAAYYAQRGCPFIRPTCPTE